MAAVLHRSESGSFQALDVIGIWERSSRGWLRYAFAAFFPLFVSSFLNFHLLLSSAFCVSRDIRSFVDISYVHGAPTQPSGIGAST